MKFYGFSLCLAAAVALSASTASAALIVGTDVGDQYLSPHSSNKGGAETVPVFCYPDTAFPFNYHYSSMPVKFSLTIPEELQGQTIQITSASITLWNSKTAGGWDPAAYQVQLYNAGVTGDHGFTRATWTEANFWYDTAGVQQDPFMVELGTGSHAEDNPNATPWAVAQIDPSYAGEATPADAFKITFTLDLTKPEIYNRLLADLSAGYSMFVVAANYPAEQTGGVYPKIVTKEGVSNANNGTLQKAPVLTLEVQGSSAVGEWTLYQ
jgi:hypothetical protein